MTTAASTSCTTTLASATAATSGRDDPAATIASYAFNRLTAGWIPELRPTITQLRDVLGDQTYESLARKGKTMTTAEMATYAYDQIDQARTELNAVSK
jgi:hypothetical protein